MFHKADRIAVLIDGQNTFYACKASGFALCYKKLKVFFAQQARLRRLQAFVISNERDGSHEFDPMRGVHDWMSYNGYHVDETVRHRVIDEQQRFSRVSISVPFTIAALRLVGHVDHIVIMSGDSDFTPLVHELQRLGIVVSVFSTVSLSEQGKPIAHDRMRRGADYFVDLKDIQDEISRDSINRTHGSNEAAYRRCA